MKKICSILLLGTLSMLFAEVFSGASQAWFLDPFGILLTFGLYLSHCLLLLWIALRVHKTTLRQLYWLGMVFGLYEAVITKVLWAGYMDASGPGFGTVLGVGFIEFPVLVLFWHPIFSFILPILSYEIISGETLVSHQKVLQRNKIKSFLIWITLFGVSLFVAMGNAFDVGQVWLSLGGSYVLVLIFAMLRKRGSLLQFCFKKKYFILGCVYLVALYAWSGFNILPGRFPDKVVPYVTILVSYIGVGFLFWRSKKNSIEVVSKVEGQYTVRDLILWGVGMIGFGSVASLTPNMIYTLLPIFYIGMALGGVILFLKSVWQSVRETNSRIG